MARAWTDRWLGVWPLAVQIGCSPVFIHEAGWVKKVWHDKPLGVLHDSDHLPDHRRHVAQAVAVLLPVRSPCHRPLFQSALVYEEKCIFL